MDDSCIRNEKSCVFGHRFHRIRVDDSCIRNKKVAFSVIVFILYVWTIAVSVTKKLFENAYVWMGSESCKNVLEESLKFCSSPKCLILAYKFSLA